ncbi:Hsp70 family protein, partial [Streptomyces sp. NPDC005828]|uniref:Hsp70 family protein n=1 Tax=Streptomyces sp. NPDC005828 TaxID=3157071 RepID=UPI0033CD9565
ANGIMHVTAKDLGTGKEQKMTVTGGSSLPKDDIDRMIREAERHAEEDRARKEAAETRNQGEQLVYRTEKLLSDNRDKIPGDVKSEVEAAVGELKEKLKGEDAAEVRTAVDRLNTVAQRIGTAMYAQQQEAQGSAGPRADGAGGDGEDDIVDAEIVDEDQREDAGKQGER